jgi:hypothetical protein
VELHGKNGWVKKHIAYETAATLVTAIGVIFLIGVYFPILNPGFYRISLHHQSLPSIGHYILGTPIGLSILAVGWYFNRKAAQLKKNQR